MFAPESPPGSGGENNSIIDTRLSRRNLIKRGAAVIAATALPGFKTSEVKSADITSLNSEIPLTPEGLSINRNGWSFSTEIDKLAPTTIGGNKITLDFQGGYLNPYPSFVFENGNLNINLSQRTSEIPLNGVRSAVTDIYPSPDSDQITITYKETNKNGEVIREDKMPQTLEYATYDPEDPNDRRRVWSESSLDQDLLKEIHDRAIPYDVFTDERIPTFIFVPNERADTAGFNTVDNYIHFPIDFLDNPEFNDVALAILDHERFHSVHTPSTLTTNDALRADEKLLKDHEKLWFEKTGVTNGFGFTPTEIVDHPAFKFFDESEYYPDARKLDRRDIGHPFSNHRELFASGMNILTKRGGEIIEKIEALTNSEEKETTVRFTNNILSLAKSIAKNEEKLFATWPELAKVNDYLSTVEPKNSSTSNS